MFDDDPLGSEPPPKPPCKHDYEYDIYYEKLKECHVARRTCTECGAVERKNVHLRDDEDIDDMGEEDIKGYFRK